MERLNFNELKEEIETLKLFINHPEDYLWDYFNSIKNEIDIEVAEQEILNSLNETDSTLTHNWLKMLTKIDEFQKECLNSLPNNLKSKSKIKHLLNIKIIENQLDNTRDSIEIYNQEDRNGLFKRLKQIKEVILEERSKMEQCLFNNKTIIYFNSFECLQFQHANEMATFSLDNLFNDVTNKTVLNDSKIGKLIIIANRYFNQRSINSLKK